MQIVSLASELVKKLTKQETNISPVGVQAATIKLSMTTRLRAAWTSTSTPKGELLLRVLHVSPKPRQILPPKYQFSILNCQFSVPQKPLSLRPSVLKKNRTQMTLIKLIYADKKNCFPQFSIVNPQLSILYPSVFNKPLLFSVTTPLFSVF